MVFPCFPICICLFSYRHTNQRMDSAKSVFRPSGEKFFPVSDKVIGQIFLRACLGTGYCQIIAGIQWAVDHNKVARRLAIIPSVEPQVTVISFSGSTSQL